MPSIVESIRIGRPAEELVWLLGSWPTDWLQPFMRIAARAGETEASRAVDGLPPGRGRRVRIELRGPISDDHDEVVVPFMLETHGYQGVFSAFSGRLVVRPRSDISSELAVGGTYALPEGPLRSRADVAERVAVATFTSLLRNLRDALEEQARSGV